MKKLFLMSGVILISLSACQKSNSNPVVTQSAPTASPESSLSTITDNLDYFVALYAKGDVMTLSAHNGIVNQTLSKENRLNQNLTEHSYSATNHAAFANWCNDQVNAGHVVNIGYDQNTSTYWADVVS